MIRTGLAWSLAALVAALGASVLAFPLVPPDAEVAIHWNIRGEADGFAGRVEALFVLPALMAGLALFFAAVPRIDPRRQGLERSRSAFMTGWLGSMAVLLLVHLIVLHGALGGEVPLRGVLAAVSVLTVLLGNAIAKSRSNWFVGVRTPWSLSSEEAWIQANRATGWGFVATGLLTLAVLLLSGHAEGVVVLVAGTIVSALVGTYVSYAVWRRGREA